MKAALRNIIGSTYKPLLEKYLSKTRTYNYGEIKLVIPPQVFHPGFFFSTKLLLNYIKRLPLQGKNFLELGCGSGLISIYAAKQGADVTATDINSIAIEFLKKNSQLNKSELTIIQSNLFQNIPHQQFDIIAINPPYYKKNPEADKDYAWFCGENGEYFFRLFKELKPFLHRHSQVIVVLFEGCDIKMIKAMAEENGFRLDCVYKKQNLLEKNFIYKIQINN